VPRSPNRQDRLDAAATLRAAGSSWGVVAEALRHRYSVNGLVACREAHGWSQGEAARRWTERWPDDPKTLKNFSYWENWPSPTGHAPSLAVLGRLAELYACRVVDLVGDWGDHSGADRRSAEAAPEQAPDLLAYEVARLDVHRLCDMVAGWAADLPTDERRSALLRLGSAAVMAATRTLTRPGHVVPPAPELTWLTGRWRSVFEYPSSSRGAAFVGRHDVDLREEGGVLVGHSLAHPEGSRLHVELSVDGLLATGPWTEHTSPNGQYRGAIYTGLLQLTIDPTGHSMSGRWLGVGRRFTLKSGEWRLDRLPAGDHAAKPG